MRLFLPFWAALAGLMAAAASAPRPPRPADEEAVTIHPAPAPGPLNNPLKGWCPYATAGPILQPYSMVFLYVPWSELEPQEGRYAFSAWERRAWESPRARGKRIVFRVYVDYPGQRSGMPGWLRAKGVRMRPYSEYGGGLAPDYDDPHMVAAMQRLLASLGRRYDQDPRVAFVEMGLLGFWGEWHTYPRTDLFASPATQQKVLESAWRAFPHKVVMTRYARGYAGAQPWLGYFDDAFPEDTDGPEEWKFLPSIRQSGRTENWQVAAIGGEMLPKRAAEFMGPGFSHALQMAQSAHFSWIGPYCPALEENQSPEFAARSAELVRKMGYQFQLTEIRCPRRVGRGGQVQVSLAGLNTGVAPLYYPWSVELALIDTRGRVTQVTPTNVDIRNWLPGPFRLSCAATIRAPAGRYRVALGIIDPWTKRPGITFANSLPRIDGWTCLCSVDVLPSRKSSAHV